MLAVLPREVREQALAAYDLFRLKRAIQVSISNASLRTIHSFLFGLAVITAPLASNAKRERFCGSGSARMKPTKGFSRLADADLRAAFLLALE
jgi:hypothetical protein